MKLQMIALGWLTLFGGCDDRSSSPIAMAQDPIVSDSQEQEARVVTQAWQPVYSQPIPLAVQSAAPSSPQQPPVAAELPTPTLIPQQVASPPAQQLASAPALTAGPQPATWAESPTETLIPQQVPSPSAQQLASAPALTAGPQPATWAESPTETLIPQQVPAAPAQQLASPPAFATVQQPHFPAAPPTETLIPQQVPAAPAQQCPAYACPQCQAPVAPQLPPVFVPQAPVAAGSLTSAAVDDDNPGSHLPETTEPHAARVRLIHRSAAEQAPTAPTDVAQTFSQALRQHLRSSLGMDMGDAEMDRLVRSLAEIRAEIGGADATRLSEYRDPNLNTLLTPSWATEPAFQPYGDPASAASESPNYQHIPIPQDSYAVTKVTKALRDAARMLDNAAADLEDMDRFEDADELRSQADDLRRKGRRRAFQPIQGYPQPAVYRPYR